MYHSDSSVDSGQYINLRNRKVPRNQSDSDFRYRAADDRSEQCASQNRLAQTMAEYAELDDLAELFQQAEDVAKLPAPSPDDALDVSESASLCQVTEKFRQLQLPTYEARAADLTQPIRGDTVGCTATAPPAPVTTTQLDDI